MTRSSEGHTPRQWIHYTYRSCRENAVNWPIHLPHISRRCKWSAGLESVADGRNWSMSLKWSCPYFVLEMTLWLSHECTEAGMNLGKQEDGLNLCGEECCTVTVLLYCSPKRYLTKILKNTTERTQEIRYGAPIFKSITVSWTTAVIFQAKSWITFCAIRSE
jgi:hypothetical protein